MKVSHLKEAIKLKLQGKALVIQRPRDLKTLVIMTPFDASIAAEADMKNQAGFFSLLISTNTLAGPAICSLVGCQTSTISHESKRARTAEPESLSMAIDKQRYLQFLVEISYGVCWLTRSPTRLSRSRSWINSCTETCIPPFHHVKRRQLQRERRKGEKNAARTEAESAAEATQLRGLGYNN